MLTYTDLFLMASVFWVTSGGQVTIIKCRRHVV